MRFLTGQWVDYRGLIFQRAAQAFAVLSPVLLLSYSLASTTERWQDDIEAKWLSFNSTSFMSYKSFIIDTIFATYTAQIELFWTIPTT